MPKFYFDIHQVNGKVVREVVGVELSDHQRARREARVFLAELAEEAIRTKDISRLKITVRDQTGAVVVVRTAWFSVEDE